MNQTDQKEAVKKIIELMKVQLGEKIMAKFVGLRAKIYNNMKN